MRSRAPHPPGAAAGNWRWVRPGGPAPHQRCPIRRGGSGAARSPLTNESAAGALGGQVVWRELARRCHGRVALAMLCRALLRRAAAPAREYRVFLPSSTAPFPTPSRPHPSPPESGVSEALTVRLSLCRSALSASPAASLGQLPVQPRR